MSKPGHLLLGAESPSDILCMQAVTNTGIAHNYDINILHAKEGFKQELDKCARIPPQFMAGSMCCRINTSCPVGGSNVQCD